MTTIQMLIDKIQVGNMSLYTAREEAKSAGIYDDTAEQQLKTAHEATMQDVCNHQDRMARVLRGR